MYGAVKNRVLAPGEKIVLLEVKDELWAERLFYDIGFNNEFSYEIYYESIYGQQWKSTGFDVEEITFP